MRTVTSLSGVTRTSTRAPANTIRTRPYTSRIPRVVTRGAGRLLCPLAALLAALSRTLSLFALLPSLLLVLSLNSAISRLSRTVYTTPAQRGHEIQIAFLIGLKVADFAFDDIELYELDVMSPPPPSPPPPPSTLLWLDGEGGPGGVQTVLATGITTGKMTADLSSTAAAHTGKYGFEITVTELFQNNWHALLSLPAFLVTDHERMYTLTFWAKGNGNPHPRPQVTFQDEDAQYAYIDSAYVQLTSFWHQYSVALAIPYRLRGHNVIANVMVGAYLGSYYFDDFQVTNNQFISPPPSPPLPPPSPPPHVLMQLSLESFQKGTINSQVRARLTRASSLPRPAPLLGLVWPLCGLKSCVLLLATGLSSTRS